MEGDRERERGELGFLRFSPQTATRILKWAQMACPTNPSPLANPQQAYEATRKMPSTEREREN